METRYFCIFQWLNWLVFHPFILNQKGKYVACPFMQIISRFFCVILRYSAFDAISRIVYDLLQSLTLKDPTWPWIIIYHRSRNERATWKALVAYYEEHSCKPRQNRNLPINYTFNQQGSQKIGSPLNFHWSIHWFISNTVKSSDLE